MQTYAEIFNASRRCIMQKSIIAGLLLIVIFTLCLSAPNFGDYAAYQEHFGYQGYDWRKAG